MLSRGWKASRPLHLRKPNRNLIMFIRHVRLGISAFNALCGAGVICDSLQLPRAHTR